MREPPALAGTNHLQQHAVSWQLVTEGQSRSIREWRRKPHANAEFQNDPCFCQLASRGWHKGGWSSGALSNPESEGWALVPEMSFLNREPSDSFWSLAGPIAQECKLILTF